MAKYRTFLLWADRDGTVIILPTSTAIAAPMMGINNVRWETFKFHWLINFTRDVSGCATSGKSGIKSATDALQRQIIFGTDGVDDPSAHHPRLLANLLGYKNKIVAGYKGTGPALLALERGEIDARCSVWASLALSTNKGDFESGKLVPILQVGTRKHPIFGKAPLILDLAKTDEHRVIMRFIVGPVEISRPFAAPPGVPADRVAALRKALWEASQSAPMKADAQKMNLIVDPMNGQETEKALRDALNVTDATVKKAMKAIMEQ